LFGWLKRDRAEAPTEEERFAPPLPRVCEVGWLVDAESAGFIYAAPRPLARARDADASISDPSPKGVNVCPAVIDVEAKTFVVTCPVDLNLTLRRDSSGQLRLVDAAPRGTATINRQHLDKMVTLLAPNRWRAPNRPVVQVSAPYRFIADEPVWMNQLPPYGHYRDPAWPGLMITGRFPIDVWPRSLLWAFEWQDPSKGLAIRRGEPWFYVRFETIDPSRPVRLVEAAMTPELREYCKGLDGVTNYVSRTFSLFAEARERRPETLLTRAPRRPEPVPDGEAGT